MCLGVVPTSEKIVHMDARRVGIQVYVSVTRYVYVLMTLPSRERLLWYRDWNYKHEGGDK